MLAYTRIRRLLLLVAAALPFSLLLVRTPQLESDLNRVYAAIPAATDFDALGSWCGLGATPATAAEKELACRVVRTAPDPGVFVCGQIGAQLFRDLATASVRPEGLRLVRIHNSTDPNRWVGVGIGDVWRTGTDPLHTIVLRVPVGFDPPPQGF
jgi:hypothetical protein